VVFLRKEIDMKDTDYWSKLSYYNWTFRQNNSFGYFIGPVEFTVTARNEDDAWDVLTKQPWFTTNYDCDCCGERWSRSSVEQSSEVY
jgi:hypothetical protein